MAVANTTGAAGFTIDRAPKLDGPQSPLGSPSQGPNAVAGEDFRRALDQAGAKPLAATNLTANPSVSGGALEKLKFSNHAIERMRSRGIAFAPETMKSIENAVSKAAAKGSKDTLVLAGDSALIVSVKNNTVVTVMDRAGMKDNVFTNIDSTVVV